MHQTTEPTRLQRDLREETWTVPGLTAIPWSTPGGQRHSGAAPFQVAPSECTCPTECLRDHENE